MRHCRMEDVGLIGLALMSLLTPMWALGPCKTSTMFAEKALETENLGTDGDRCYEWTIVRYQGTTRYLWIDITVYLDQPCYDVYLEVTDSDSHDGEKYDLNLCQTKTFSRYFYNKAKVVYGVRSQVDPSPITIKYKMIDLSQVIKYYNSTFELTANSTQAYEINLHTMPKLPTTPFYIRFSAPYHSSVHLTFQNLTSTFCSNSSAVLYDGYLPELSYTNSSFCEAEPSSSINVTSFGRYFYLKFILRPAEVTEYFQTTVRPLSIPFQPSSPATQTCNGEVVGLMNAPKYQVLTSPELSSLHPPTDIVTCLWRLRSHTIQTIEIVDLDAPAFNVCSTFSLKIYDDFDLDPSTLTEMCNSQFMGTSLKGYSGFYSISFSVNYTLHPKGFSIRYWSGTETPVDDDSSSSSGLDSTSKTIIICVSIAVVVICIITGVIAYRHHQSSKRRNAAHGARYRNGEDGPHTDKQATSSLRADQGC